MTRIKICGMTNRDDALAAAALGADALGFIFAESPRQVGAEEAREIIRALPPLITTVGVFVDEARGTVEQIYSYCGLDLVQLHGNEDGAYLSALGLPAIKAFRVKDGNILSEIERLKPEYFLLDTFDEIHAGGTGKKFDWDIAARATGLGEVMLSGGLDPANVTEALETVRPYAVDVCSGVESSPGKKDHTKLMKFIQEVRKWDSRTD